MVLLLALAGCKDEPPQEKTVCVTLYRGGESWGDAEYRVVLTRIDGAFVPLANRNRRAPYSDAQLDAVARECREMIALFSSRPDQARGAWDFALRFHFLKLIESGNFAQCDLLAIKLNVPSAMSNRILNAIRDDLRASEYGTFLLELNAPWPEL